jgi:hypothetical protein
MASISIITSVDGIYGSGHASRMAFLAEFLTGKGHRVSAVCPVRAGEVVPALKPYIRETIPSGTNLIIRDMRDSDEAEIRILKEEAPVIAVDDCGGGRNSADMIIHCLPNLLDSSPLPPLEESPFLFGHSFELFMKQNREKMFVKDIDLCVYAGQNPSDEYLGKVLSAIPLSETTAELIQSAFPGTGLRSSPETGPYAKSICITGKGDPVLFGNGADAKAPASFPEALLRSHKVITHFGITLFEAYVCGCVLYTINPGEYHRLLCERAKDSLGLENLGTADGIETVEAKNRIASGAYANRIIRTQEIMRTISCCAENFYSRMSPLLQD